MRLVLLLVVITMLTITYFLPAKQPFVSLKNINGQTGLVTTTGRISNGTLCDKADSTCINVIGGKRHTGQVIVTGYFERKGGRNTLFVKRIE